MKKIIQKLLRSTAGQLIISLYIENLILVLVQKSIKMYGWTPRSEYVRDFLHAESTRQEISKFISDGCKAPGPIEPANDKARNKNVGSKNK